MKVVIAAFLFFTFLAAGTSFSQESTTNKDNISRIQHSPDRVKFDPSANPEKDLKKAIAEARKSGKNILLDVGGEWCIWCHRLDKLFEDNKDLSEFEHNNYVVVKINYSKENKNEKFLSKFPKVAGYPHLFVLDKNGRLLHSQDTGQLENTNGGHDKSKVFEFLKKWAPDKNS